MDQPCSKIVLGGRFRVFSDGTINRIKDGIETPATINYKCRNKKYAVVNYMENGNQRHAYLHRIVATAFVPNPQKLPQVNHIDGDTRNNRAENLEWVTAAENMYHAFQNGLEMPGAAHKPCAICGNFTGARDGICPSCKQEIIKLRNKMEKVRRQKESFKWIDCADLPKRTACYVLYAKKGYSSSEIAKMEGVSRQAVDFSLKKVLQDMRLRACHEG